MRENSKFSRKFHRLSVNECHLLSPYKLTQRYSKETKDIEFVFQNRGKTYV